MQILPIQVLNLCFFLTKRCDICGWSILRCNYNRFQYGRQQISNPYVNKSCELDSCRLHFPSRSLTSMGCPRFLGKKFFSHNLKMQKAPEIHFVNGQYLAYYVARNTHGVLSVGVAFSSNVTGPYKVNHLQITQL